MASGHQSEGVVQKLKDSVWQGCGLKSQAYFYADGADRVVEIFASKPR
jgi:hypothetical protein